jgi:hypothetical protein
VIASRDDAALVADWAALEQRYRANRYRGIGAPDELHLVEGRSGVLLTAGHSVEHVRGGSRKPPDLRTGGLAELVAARSGAGVLTVVGAGPGDPNRDARHPFKLALRGLAATHAIVLDLHGMRDDHGIDVCVGSGRADDAALAETCRASAEAAGMRVAVNEPFSASRASTIASTAQRHGCRAAQLELAAARRDLAGRPDDAGALAAWLVGLVRALGSPVSG